MNVISRINLEMTQYGLNPKYYCSNLFTKSEFQPILLNSIPKSGTNLASRTLYLHGKLSRKLSKTLVEPYSEITISKLRKINPGKFATAHLFFNKQLDLSIKEHNVKQLLMIRDPRDIAVSEFTFITYKDKSHRLHNFYSTTLKNDSDRLLHALTGIKADQLNPRINPEFSLYEKLNRYLDWTKKSSVHLVRFEDLVGVNGGGTLERQYECVAGIYKYLGHPLPSEEINRICTNLYTNKSKTFHKGQIGEWKKHYKEIHERELKIIEPILDKLGYS